MTAAGGPLGLRNIDQAGIELIMSWVDDAQLCRIWGGPGFRHPFTLETFTEDGRFADLTSRLLEASPECVLAFGQLYEKSKRIHLGRLIVSPAHRRRGHGVALINALLRDGLRNLQLEETSLYVYKYNSPAVNCYRKLGYRVAPPPVEDPLFKDCLFMVAQVADVLARDCAAHTAATDSKNNTQMRSQ